VTEAELTLDCLGQKCPQPIIQLARQIGQVEIGNLVELLSDDPAAGPDLAAWCRMRGHELVVSEPPKFLVRRAH
jgi:tRNA 2-thiouridine synthesizing protein A